MSFSVHPVHTLRPPVGSEFDTTSDLWPLQVAQLYHELNLKDELLQFYTNAAEESEEFGSSPRLAFSSVAKPLFN